MPRPGNSLGKLMLGHNLVAINIVSGILIYQGIFMVGLGLLLSTFYLLVYSDIFFIIFLTIIMGNKLEPK